MSEDAHTARTTKPRQSPVSRYVLKRFAIKLAPIAFFALAQMWTPWGFADALVALAAGSGVLDAGMALLLRQPVRGPDLSP